MSNVIVRNLAPVKNYNNLDVNKQKTSESTESAFILKIEDNRNFSQKVEGFFNKLSKLPLSSVKSLKTLFSNLIFSKDTLTKKAENKQTINNIVDILNSMPKNEETKNKIEKLTQQIKEFDTKLSHYNELKEGYIRIQLREQKEKLIQERNSLSKPFDTNDAQGLIELANKAQKEIKQTIKQTLQLKNNHKITKIYNELSNENLLPNKRASLTKELIKHINKAVPNNIEDIFNQYIGNKVLIFNQYIGNKVLAKTQQDYQNDINKLKENKSKIIESDNELDTVTKKIKEIDLVLESYTNNPPMLESILEKLNNKKEQLIQKRNQLLTPNNIAFVANNTSLDKVSKDIASIIKNGTFSISSIGNKVRITSDNPITLSKELKQIFPRFESISSFEIPRSAFTQTNEGLTIDSTKINNIKEISVTGTIGSNAIEATPHRPISKAFDQVNGSLELAKTMRLKQKVTEVSVPKSNLQTLNLVANNTSLDKVSKDIESIIKNGTFSIRNIGNKVRITSDNPITLSKELKQIFPRFESLSSFEIPRSAFTQTNEGLTIDSTKINDIKEISIIGTISSNAIEATPDIPLKPPYETYNSTDSSGYDTMSSDRESITSFGDFNNSIEENEQQLKQFVERSKELLNSIPADINDKDVIQKASVLNAMFFNEIDTSYEKISIAFEELTESLEFATLGKAITKNKEEASEFMLSIDLAILDNSEVKIAFDKLNQVIHEASINKKTLDALLSLFSEFKNTVKSVILESTTKTKSEPEQVSEDKLLENAKKSFNQIKNTRVMEELAKRNIYKVSAILTENSNIQIKQEQNTWSLSFINNSNKMQNIPLETIGFKENIDKSIKNVSQAKTTFYKKVEAYLNKKLPQGALFKYEENSTIEVSFFGSVIIK